MRLLKNNKDSHCYSRELQPLTPRSCEWCAFTMHAYEMPKDLLDTGITFIQQPVDAE